MKTIKYILTLAVIFIIARVLGGLYGYYTAQHKPEYQSHNIASPTDNIPAYEYKKEDSARCDFPEYISQKHNFKVRFPSEPTVTNIGGITNYGAIVEGEAAYNIFIDTLRKTFTRDEDIKSYLRGILAGRLIVYGDKADLKKSREVLFLGNRAIEYEYTADIDGKKAYFQGVHFLKGNLVYGITIVCGEDAKDLAYSKYADFIVSFRLNPSHSKPTRRQTMADHQNQISYQSLPEGFKIVEEPQGSLELPEGYVLEEKEDEILETPDPPAGTIPEETYLEDLATKSSRIPDPPEGVVFEEDLEVPPPPEGVVFEEPKPQDLKFKSSESIPIPEGYQRARVQAELREQRLFHEELGGDRDFGAWHRFFLCSGLTGMEILKAVTGVAGRILKHLGKNKMTPEGIMTESKSKPLISAPPPP